MESYRDVLNSPSSAVWEYVWSVANQRRAHRAVVPRVFIWGQLCRYGASSWLTLAIQCLAPSSAPRGQTNMGWPSASGIQKQAFAISHIVSLSYLVKLIEGGQRTQEYRNSLRRQDIPRNQRLSPRSWLEASLPEVSPFLEMYRVLKQEGSGQGTTFKRMT